MPEYNTLAFTFTVDQVYTKCHLGVRVVILLPISKPYKGMRGGNYTQLASSLVTVVSVNLASCVAAYSYSHSPEHVSY